MWIWHAATFSGIMVTALFSVFWMRTCASGILPLNAVRGNVFERLGYGGHQLRAHQNGESSSLAFASSMSGM
jgi:hypothetical protein